MKNTFEPFKNHRKSRHPDYQKNGEYDIFLFGFHLGTICKNCKKPLGDHCSTGCPKSPNN